MEPVFQIDLPIKPQAYCVVIDVSESTKIQACSPNVKYCRNLKFHFCYVIIYIIIFMLLFLFFFYCYIYIICILEQSEINAV